MPTTTLLSTQPLITASFTISPRGPFSLAEAATFGFGQRDGRGWDGVMRLAFCVDGYATQAAAEVRQDTGGDVHLAVFAPSGTDLAAVRDQTARVLSLDHDATEFARLGERDPVIGRLQAVAPGLRPPLFHSPYEAAAWSVLSARRPARAMMHIRALLSEAHGRTFDVAGQRLAAFPTPGPLLRVDPSRVSARTRSSGCTAWPAPPSRAVSTSPPSKTWVPTRPWPGSRPSRASARSTAP